VRTFGTAHSRGVECHQHSARGVNESFNFFLTENRG
jgi:hypothetical protein